MKVISKLESTGSRHTCTRRHTALTLPLGAGPHTGWLPPPIGRDQHGFILTGSDLPDRRNPAASRTPSRPAGVRVAPDLISSAAGGLAMKAARGAAPGAAAEAAAESGSTQVSILGLRRVSKTCGQGATCPGLQAIAVAVAVAVTGLLAAACGPGPRGGSATAAPPAATAAPPAATSAPPAAPVGGTGDCDSVTTCYTPRQLEVAYGIRPLLERGIDGRGQTVVLPELAESQQSPPPGGLSDLRQDFASFDHLFGLPAPQLRVVSTFAGSADPWLANGEEVLDAEMVHTIAPGAALTIVLVRGTSLDSAASAVAASVAALRLGMSQGGIISLSPAGQIGGEHCVSRTQLASLNAALQADADHHVTVVAASGDAGAAGEPCALITALFGIGTFPPPVKELGLVASDPLVLSVGGTTLHASHTTGAYLSETAWGLPYGTPGTWVQASGGGFSHLFTRPAYQDGVPGIGANRGVPDVAADANPHTGMTIVISDGRGGYTIRNSGGTSASAPTWAGVIALADQYAGRHLGFVNPAIYRIALSHHQAFHDITAGNNTASFPPKTIIGYRAAPGWDPVTGWGSPDAEVLVPLLARYASP